jgi:hypothetical protein
MAQARRRRMRQDGRKRPARIDVPSAASSPATKPARGVRLSTVSRITVLFALACLAAFTAGRPPLSPVGPVRGQEHAPEVGSGPVLRQDDAGRFLGRRRGERKTGTQEIEKGARARASVGVLLADPKEKNEQPKHL